MVSDGNKMKSKCKVEVPTFDPESDLIEDKILELQMLAEMGFNEADLIYSFCLQNNMLSVIRHQQPNIRRSLPEFINILRERYSDQPHSAAVRFSAYMPPPNSDEQDIFNSIVRLYQNMVSSYHSIPIDRAGFNIINEKFLATIQDDQTRVLLRQMKLTGQELVDTARSFRKSKLSDQTSRSQHAAICSLAERIAHFEESSESATNDTESVSEDSETDIDSSSEASHSYPESDTNSENDCEDNDPDNSDYFNEEDNSNHAYYANGEINCYANDPGNACYQRDENIDSYNNYQYGPDNGHNFEGDINNGEFYYDTNDHDDPEYSYTQSSNETQTENSEFECDN